MLVSLLKTTLKKTKNKTLTSSGTLPRRCTPFTVLVLEMRPNTVRFINIIKDNIQV